MIQGVFSILRSIQYTEYSLSLMLQLSEPKRPLSLNSRKQQHKTKFPVGPRKSSFGIHSGWSRPLPYHILSESAPQLTEMYQNLFKQKQIKMEIFEQCQDGNYLYNLWFDVWPSSYKGKSPANYHTNTYYPPGRCNKGCKWESGDGTQYFHGLQQEPGVIIL